jgi:hypothetical protein
MASLRIGLHGFVLIYGLAQTGRDEGRKRQRLFASGFLLMDDLTWGRDIDFR